MLFETKFLKGALFLSLIKFFYAKKCLLGETARARGRND